MTHTTERQTCPCQKSEVVFVIVLPWAKQESARVSWARVRIHVDLWLWQESREQWCATRSYSAPHVHISFLHVSQRPPLHPLCSFLSAREIMRIWTWTKTRHQHINTHTHTHTHNRHTPGLQAIYRRHRRDVMQVSRLCRLDRRFRNETHPQEAFGGMMHTVEGWWIGGRKRCLVTMVT